MIPKLLRKYPDNLSKILVRQQTPYKLIDVSLCMSEYKFHGPCNALSFGLASCRDFGSVFAHVESSGSKCFFTETDIVEIQTRASVLSRRTFNLAKRHSSNFESSEAINGGKILFA